MASTRLARQQSSGITAAKTGFIRDVTRLQEGSLELKMLRSECKWALGQEEGRIRANGRRRGIPLQIPGCSGVEGALKPTRLHSNV